MQPERHRSLVDQRHAHVGAETATGHRRVQGFGAIDQILRADLPLANSLLALLFYNLVFVLPLASLALVRVLVPTQSEQIFRLIENVSAKASAHERCRRSIGTTSPGPVRSRRCISDY